jgi:hypothetical protein
MNVELDLYAKMFMVRKFIKNYSMKKKMPCVMIAVGSHLAIATRVKITLRLKESGSR